MQERADRPARLRTIALGRGDLASFRLRVFEAFSYPTGSGASSEPAHRHDFQELLWIDSGAGHHSIDGIDYAIEPCSFYFIARGQVHQFLEAKDLFALMICFTEDFLPGFVPGKRLPTANPLFSPLQAPRTLAVPADQAPRYRSVLEQIRREHEQPGDEQKARILGNLVDVLLAMLERGVRHAAAPEGDPDGVPARLCGEFAALLEQHYAARHDVAFYARTLRVPAHALSQCTKRGLGKTPKQLIEERLFLEAKRYLRFTTLSVKEISYALGFEDASYFSRSFKRLGGLPPQEFRAG